MTIVDAREAAVDLGALLKKIAYGETIVIAVNNRPLAEMRQPSTVASSPRPFGLCAGEFVTPDNFDAPLPVDVLADFAFR